jgi:beta-glucosidase
VDLEAGKLYAVRLDFHQFVGNAHIRLEWSLPPADQTAEALAIARQADATVLVLGLSPRLEGEEMSVPVPGFAGGDRVSLDLPATQEELMQKVVALGKPVVLVMMNGSAVAINWARDHVPAIVEAWYPGQAGGEAIADVLFGDYNPGGRLPVTFYKSAEQLPPFTDYSMKGRTYRFFEGEPLFRFGYGLSYTTFAYRNAKLTSGKVSVEVENTGAVAGDEVVQAYVKGSLAGFQRVGLKAREKRVVEIPVGADVGAVTVGGVVVKR